MQIRKCHLFINTNAIVSVYFFFFAAVAAGCAELPVLVRIENCKFFQGIRRAAMHFVCSCVRLESIDNNYKIYSYNIFTPLQSVHFV